MIDSESNNGPIDMFKDVELVLLDPGVLFCLGCNVGGHPSNGHVYA